MEGMGHRGTWVRGSGVVDVECREAWVSIVSYRWLEVLQTSLLVGYDVGVNGYRYIHELLL